MLRTRWESACKGKPDIETVTTSERLITRRLDLAAEHAVTFGPTARRSL
jgi:hypothetical protein